MRSLLGITTFATKFEVARSANLAPRKEAALFSSTHSLATSFFQISICLGSIKVIYCVRPGPIFGLEAMEVSKDGILLSWLPGSREVEEYRLTITSECNNWKIPECENTARRIQRSTDEDFYNTVEDDDVMKLLELSYDDTGLMGDEKMGDNDMGNDKEDTKSHNADCKVRTVFH